jgi:hypothetical protein
MNESILEEILMRIQNIEKRPSMYGLSDSFEALSSLISGYFLGLDTTLKMDLNKQFADWILLKSRKPASTWAACILLLLADNDEVRAKETLFVELKAFLEHLIEKPVQ